MKNSNILKQDISYVTSKDGMCIARASMGEGHTIVRAAHWLTHISRDLESPVWRHWLAELSSLGQLVRYDLRGCGLSSGDLFEISFEAWFADLEAVTENIEEPFTLLGMSQGAALSIAYAHLYPEKVKQIILIGGYAKGLLVRNASENAHLEATTLTNLIRLGWGLNDIAFNQVFTHLFIPEGTQYQHDWWRALERETASAEVAAQTMAVLNKIDVSEIAAKLNVPTIVLHARGDRRVPFEQGRLLAMTIPGAEFVPLDSNNHVLLDNEPAWSEFQSALGGFLRMPPKIRIQKRGLTRAEVEVLELVAQGLSNSDIAIELDKSVKTVRNQISSLLEKTGLNTRSELIVRTLSGSLGQKT